MNRAIRIGAWALLLAGLGHVLTLLDVAGVWVFAPHEAAVRDAMRGGPIVLAALLGSEAPVWEAYLGFSLSHGLGLAFFGVVHLQLLRREPDFYPRNRWLLSLSVGWAAMWLGLAAAFWFYPPVLIAALALACFVFARARVADT